MELKPLTEHFGVELAGFDLAQVNEESFAELRALFDTHSALLIRGQDISDEVHLRLGRLFGPIEDRYADERKPGEAFAVPQVSNIKEDGSVADQSDLHMLHLKANFLWHATAPFCLFLHWSISSLRASCRRRAARPSWPRPGPPGPRCRRS